MNEVEFHFGSGSPFSYLLKRAAIAETHWHLAHQDRGAWMRELEVCPFKEKF